MRTERLRAAFENIAAADADGCKAGEKDGDHPGTAVFDTDDAVALLEQTVRNITPVLQNSFPLAHLTVLPCLARQFAPIFLLE